MVSEEHITCFGWANTADLDDIVALTLRINDFLSGLLLGVGITLVDFKLEFGRLWENEEMRIILADEISPEQLPAVGQQDQREDGQGPLSQGPRQGRGGVPGSRPPPWHPAGGRDARPKGAGDDAVRATVTVMPKAGVLDPQGRAIAHALGTLGFGGVTDVRAGKVIELELAETDPDRARAAADEMARRLLANMVIESFTVRVDG